MAELKTKLKGLKRELKDARKVHVVTAPIRTVSESQAPAQKKRKKSHVANVAQHAVPASVQPFPGDFPGLSQVMGITKDGLRHQNGIHLETCQSIDANVKRIPPSGFDLCEHCIGKSHLGLTKKHFHCHKCNSSFQKMNSAREHYGKC